MSRWTDALAKSRGHKTKAKNKFGAHRSNCGKHNHMSVAEADCCLWFQMREKAGELEILKSQPNVFVTEARLRIIPDWLLRLADGSEVYADYKGCETASFGRNKRLWKHYGPKPMWVVKKGHRGFFVSETIQGGKSE